MKSVLIFLFALIPAILALPLDVIDIDTAQYAEIGREMVEKGNYIFLRDNGNKYLDKPILTFLNIALFFKILGIGEIQFRLTAVLALVLTSLSLMHLTYLIYGNKQRSLYAGIIYLIIPGTFTIVLNPLIDIYLCMYLTFIHHMYYLGVKKNRNWYLLMYWFIGMGFITKGPISAVLPAITIGGDILIRRDWERLKSMHLIPGILITSLLPGLWSYALYLEYEEYGPFFFLWQQSFGRFYDKIYNEKFDPFFFYNNFLWGVLPFSFYFLIKIASEIKIYFKSKPKHLENLKDFFVNRVKNYDLVIVFWVFLYLFLISFSKFQLPQYTYWALPGGAIFISGLLLNSELTRTQFLIRNIPSILALGFLILIPIFVIDANFYYWISFILLLIIGAGLYHSTKDSFLITITPFVAMMAMVSLFVFPELVKYQPSKEVGKIIREMEPNQESFYSFGIPFSKRSYEFYSKRFMRNLFKEDQLEKNLLKTGDFRLVVVQFEYFPFLSERFGNKYEYKIVKEFPSFKIATPNKKFINKATREKVLSKVLLVQITKK